MSTELLLETLVDAGYEVQTPVTGSVWVDGDEILPSAWDQMVANWDGTLAGLEDIGFEAKEVVYTYTVFDGDPACSGNCSWPSHERVEVEGDPKEILAETLDDVAEIARNCNEYEVGDRLWVTVWNVNGTIVASGSIYIYEDEDEDEDEDA